MALCQMPAPSDQLEASASITPARRIPSDAETTALPPLSRRQAHVRSPEVEEVLGLAADAFGSTAATFSKMADGKFVVEK